ncbi:MAG: DNA polymerase III subunit delta [Bacteroidales bacterium]|nr:DNA polymerase III subunit delta [Bacteroidales bacterium]
MLFKDITGQQAAAQQLRDAIDNDRMPHALLISGREGSGALTLALTAAQYILCENHTPDGEPCERCPHCLQIHKLQHPDLHFAFPVVNRKGQSGDDPAVSLDYIAEWRDILLRRPDITYTDWVKFISDEGKNAQIYKAEASSIIRILSTKPYESDKRVMIIWLPEKINETASNKLLKIIEEPYPKTFFLLVSNDPDRVLGTILSRCQRLNIPPLDPCWMQPRIEPDERQYFFDKFCAMMRLSYMRRIFDMRDWSVEMAGLGRQRQQDFLQYAQSMIRENFILNVSMPEGQSVNYMDDQEAQFSSRFHLYVNHRNVEGIMNELAQAEKDIAQNGAAKIIFFDLSLKLIMLLKQ